MIKGGVITVFFFLLGLYCYIIYPVWYLPSADYIKVIYLNIVLINLLVLTGLFYYILKKHPDATKDGKDRMTGFKDTVPYLFITFICLLFQMVQINYPILTGLDSHLHTGLPAVLVSKANDLVLTHTAGYLNIHILIWFLILSLFIFIRLKRSQADNIRIDKKLLIVLALTVIILSNLYGFLLIKSRILEKEQLISIGFPTSSDSTWSTDFYFSEISMSLCLCVL